MQRRDFLKAASAFAFTMALSPAARAAATGLKLKITDLKLRKVRLVKDLGTLMTASGTVTGTAAPWHETVGGDTITEIHTDQGVVGIGPGVSGPALASFKRQLVGHDALDLGNLAYQLYGRQGGAYIEIALWDLLGKATNLPLYKIWGAVKDRVMPYASQVTLGTPEERARMALTVKAAGWKAIKLCARFETLKEDVKLVEVVRKAVGDDFLILVDANQPGNLPEGHNGLPTWDLQRATETANEYEKLNVYWLEEPLGRYDYDELSELHRRISLPLAGGELNHGLHEFREFLERDCYDFLNTEVMQEGPTMVRQIGDLALAFGQRIVPHEASGLGTICSIHFAGSWRHCPTLELSHEPPIDDIFAQWSVYENPPVLDKDGTIGVPDAPGLGVTIKSDLLEDV